MAKIYIYNLIWNEEKSDFQPINPRHIHWVYSKRGNVGKSIFVKWLAINKPETIIKISFGTPNQLRSSLIAAGPKKCYFLDIPKTKNSNEDNLDNILSIIEDAKLGFLVSNFYGNYKTLIMDPPLIFIFSNDECPVDKLSEDRWQVFRINKKDFTLTKMH